MRCPLCGIEVTEGAPACKGCAASKGCSLLRCPNCGYEIPKEPGFMKIFRRWKEKRDAAKRQG